MFGKKDMVLGKSIHTGKNIIITPKQRRTHMHVIGQTGKGKSRFLQHLIRSDIINGNGLCLVDPHGTLYDDIVDWCAYKGMLNRGKHNKKIVLLDPRRDDWIFGFNPLKADREAIPFFADAMVKAISMVWGGEDTDKTPRLERVLSVVLQTLMEKKLTLLEAMDLMRTADKEKRQFLTSGIQDSLIQEEWREFNSFSTSKFEERFESTRGRLTRFFKGNVIKRIIGQTEKTIDFRKIMDDGGIVLINLAVKKGKFSRAQSRLLGTLIVNDIIMNSDGREKDLAEKQPFYLYIDECQNYINKDIGDILNEMRKFGLHAILANQHLAQLKQAGEEVFSSVMTNAVTKIVFGGISHEDSIEMTENIFKGWINHQEPKSIMIKPTVVGYKREWFESHSESTGLSSGQGGSKQELSSTGVSQGESTSQTVNPYNFADTSEVRGVSTNHQTGFSSSQGASWQETESYSSTKGMSEGLVPILEDRPTELYSHQEQIERASALMVNQAPQHAIIKLPVDKNPKSGEPKFIKAPFIQVPKIRDRVKYKFIETSFQLNECIKPVALVETEGRKRIMQLEDKYKVVENEKEPESFKEDQSKVWEEPEEPNGKIVKGKTKKKNLDIWD